MNELKRLRTSRGNPALTRLLEAGRDERPSASALRRTLLAVGGAGVALSAGVSTAAAATSKTAASSGVATLAAGSAGTPTAVASGSAISAATGGASGAGLGGTIGATSATLKLAIGSTALAVGKWTAIGAVGLGVASQVPEWTNDAAEPPRTVAAVEVDTAVEVGTADDGKPTPIGGTPRDPHELLPQGEHPSSVDANPIEESLRPATVQRSTSTQASVEGSPPPRANSATGPSSVGNEQVTGQQNPENRVPLTRSSADEPASNGASNDAEALAAEVSLVDRARTLTRSGSSHAALKMLTGYERTFPRQQLLVEVVVLRMEAEYALGHEDRAAAFANRVLGMPSGAPHRTRAREILRFTQR